MKKEIMAVFNSTMANNDVKETGRIYKAALQTALDNGLTTEAQFKSVLREIRRNGEWSTTSGHADLVKFFENKKTIVGCNPRLMSAFYKQFVIDKAEKWVHPDKVEKAV